jgi:DNA-binding transcriptional MerR regulator
MNKTIGKVARALGMKPNTIRYYEALGVVPAPRRERSGRLSAGRRVYEDRDVERLRFVKEARRLNFSLHEVRQLLEQYETGPPCGCAARPFLKALVARRLTELEGAMRSMEALRDELSSLHTRVLADEGKGPAELLRRTTPTPVDALLGGTARKRTGR